MWALGSSALTHRAISPVPHLSPSKLSQAVLAHPKVLGTFSCLLVTVIFPSEYFLSCVLLFICDLFTVFQKSASLIMGLCSSFPPIRP